MSEQEEKNKIHNEFISAAKMVSHQIQVMHGCRHGAKEEFIAKDGIRCGQCFMDECVDSRDQIESLTDNLEKAEVEIAALLVERSLLKRKLIVAEEALEKISGMERMTFAECTDAEFIMDTAKIALLKIGEKNV